MYYIDKLVIVIVVIGQITIPGTETGTGVGARPIESQERHSTQPSQPKKPYECKNGRVIIWFQVCDGKRDCTDGADELNCTTCSGLVEETFHCDSGQCILQSQFCDKSNDCKDGSDEKFNCSGTIPPPEVPDVNTSETGSSSTDTNSAFIIPVAIIAVLLLAICILICIFSFKIQKILYQYYQNYKPVPVCLKPSQDEIRGKALPLLKVSKLKPFPQQQSSSNNDIPLQNLSPSSSYKLITKNLVSVVEKVGDHPFAVYCMVGDSRNGKSYLLNDFKQKLSDACQPGSAPEPAPALAPTELQKNYSHQRIFKWGKGNGAKTVGINIWSEPFFKTLPDGRKVAILLMDSEGFFGEKREMEENNVVFALCSIFSSVLMANCRSETLTTTLQHLHDISSYARYIDFDGNTNEDQPLQGGQSQCQGQGQVQDQCQGQGQGQVQGSQKLVIMVRDFVNQDQFSHGYHDEESAPENSLGNYYKTQLNIDENNSVSHEHKLAMDGILKNCKSVKFTLLPDPGEEFRRDPLKNPPVPEFIRVRDDTVDLLLSPEHIETKKLFNKEVTGNKFISFVRELDNVFEDKIKKFPQSEKFNNYLDAISYSKVYTAAYDYFVVNLQLQLEENGNGGSDTEMDDDELEVKLFNTFCEKAVSTFTSFTQFRVEKTANVWEKRLRDKCRIKFDEIMAEYEKTRALKRNLEQ